MPRQWSSHKKPQEREPVKKPQPIKKTLSEQVSDRVHSIGQARRERAQEEQRALHRKDEDEMMALMYGPDWRTKHIEGDPPEDARKAS